GPDQVDLNVVSCGVCHSDLSMADNAWGFTTFPFVPGHEVIGTVAAVGSSVKHLTPGQTVGMGWYAHSCGTCRSCVAGDRNLCAVSSRDAEAMKAIRGSLDFIVSTVDANLDWPAILETLGPRGRLHVVGVVPDAIPVSAFALIMAQRSVSGSPSGSPATLAAM